MILIDKIYDFFPTLPLPISLFDELFVHDTDASDASNFSGRGWHELNREDWNRNSGAIFRFNSKAFVYFLPSILNISLKDRSEFHALDVLVSMLDTGGDRKLWSDHFCDRFLVLSLDQIKILLDCFELIFVIRSDYDLITQERVLFTLMVIESQWAES